MSLDAITTNSRIFTAVVSFETSASVLIHREGTHGGYGHPQLVPPTRQRPAGRACLSLSARRGGFPVGQGGDN